MGAVSAAHNPRKIHGALEVVGLDPDTRVTASELNVVDRARLEIARALATKPVVLLLDEVMA
ncbi:MAG TPA: ATP-binding cassette domain-containing protein, partial [Limnochordales bacterium]